MKSLLASNPQFRAALTAFGWFTFAILLVAITINLIAFIGTSLIKLGLCVVVVVGAAVAINWAVKRFR